MRQKPNQKNSPKRDLRKKLLNWLLKSLPFLAIIATVLVFFYPVWLRGYVPLPADLIVGSYYPWRDYFGHILAKNPITTDAASYSFPMRILGIDILKSGQAPLWNPLILAGTPLLANFQSAPFSPTNFVYFIFDKLTAWSLQVILQHILAVSFVYLLLRHWLVSRLGALLGGVVFAFSGFVLIWSQWNAHSLAAAFIPLILYFEDRFLATNNLRNGAALSILLGLQMFSGYPQIALYTFVAVILLLLVRLGLPGKIWQWREWLLRIVLVNFFVVLGLGLAALQILPGAELLSLSQREVEPIPRNWAFLPWEKTITFIAPDYFGNHANGDWWGPQNYTSNTGFVGVVALTLALIGLGFLKRNKAVLFAFLLAGASLILSFPTPISAYIWESGIFGLQAGASHRALVLFTLSIACLAGFGIDYLGFSKKFSWKLLFLPHFLVAGFAALAFLTPDYTAVALGNLIFPSIVIFATTILLFLMAKKKFTGASFAFLGLLLIIEMFRFGWRFTPFSERRWVYPLTPVLQFLAQETKGPFRVTGADVMPVNQGMPLNLEFPGGYEAVYPLRMAQFMAALNSGEARVTPQDRYAIINNINSPLLDLMNTKYLLAKHDFDFDEARFKKIFTDRSVSILENKKALPRVFMTYDWEVIKEEETQLARLLDPNFPLEKKVVLADEVGLAKAGSASYVLTSIEYQPNSLATRVDTEKPGLLFTSDAWYPGWKAFVDEQETPVLRADYTYRAIAIPTGSHAVKFIYEPDSYKIGKIISGATLIFLVALFVTKRNYGLGQSQTT